MFLSIHRSTCSTCELAVHPKIRMLKGKYGALNCSQNSLLSHVLAHPTLRRSHAPATAVPFPFVAIYSGATQNKKAWRIPICSGWGIGGQHLIKSGRRQRIGTRINSNCPRAFRNATVQSKRNVLLSAASRLHEFHQLPPRTRLNACSGFCTHPMRRKSAFAGSPPSQPPRWPPTS